MKVRSSLDEELNKLEKLKFRLYIVVVTVIAVWVFMVAYLFYFKTPTNIEYSLSQLNSAGGFFNIVTSLASVITVWFVAQAVINQKEELIKLNDQMESQKNSLQNEEKINRSMKLYEEWLAIKNNPREKKKEEEKNTKKIAKNNIEYIHYKYGREKYYILSISRIYSTDFKNHIDFSLLMDLIKKEGVLNFLEDAIISLSRHKKISEINLENKLLRHSDMSKNTPPGFKPVKHNIRESEFEIRGDIDSYKSNIEYFQLAINEFNTSLSEMKKA